MRRPVERTLAAATALPAVSLSIAAAWLLIGGTELSGASVLLHHHALIEHGPPLWIALPVFLAAWLVMVVAMMLPASSHAISAFVGSGPGAGTMTGTRRRRPIGPFLAPYLLIWVGFGVAVFLGDTVLHQLVHATPWLAERPWLIDVAVIAFAGLYQFSSMKRRSLAVCRHPGLATAPGRSVIDAGVPGRLGPGLDHAIACLVSSGPLMLLMFAAGFSSPLLMVALTATMAYEATGRHGQGLARIAGAALLGCAVAVALAAVVP